MRRAELAEGWRRIWIVALREIRERGGSRAYRISTVLAVLLVVAVILIPSLIRESKTYQVGLTGAIPAGAVAELEVQAGATGHQLETTRYATPDQGERAVRDKKIDVLLVDGSRLEWRTGSDSTLTAVIANALQAVHIRQQADRLGIPADVLGWTLIWFILGYLFYSVLYAALGATTSRIEDAQSAIAPITGLMLLSYLGVIYAEENPDAALTVILSYFPPTAPIVMTYRVAVHAAPGWQIITAAIVTALAIWALMRTAGRIYSGALLRFGGRVPLRDLLRSGTT